MPGCNGKPKIYTKTVSSVSCGLRSFRNRREVGGALGLAPTPYSSGQDQREPGISKAGHARARALLVELAWLWLRYQPESAISRWFLRRFSGGGKRLRRIGIVAVARRLGVARWRSRGLCPRARGSRRWWRKRPIRYSAPLGLPLTLTVFQPETDKERFMSQAKIGSITTAPETRPGSHPAVFVAGARSLYRLLSRERVGGIQVRTEVRHG